MKPYCEVSTVTGADGLSEAVDASSELVNACTIMGERLRWKSASSGPRKLGQLTRVLAPMVGCLGILLLTLLLSCSRPGPSESAAPTDPATRLQAIPVADPAKYGSKSQTSDWKNPYLIVRDDGIGLLDLSNDEIHVLKPDEVPAALAALPASAWPYGRVVAVQENSDAAGSESTKAQLRQNRALLAGSLEELKIAINWVPSG